MFSRAKAPPRIDTLIGRSARLHGDMQFEGGMHLDGRIQGGLRASDARPSSLTVSESGAIEGPVEADTVVLHGTVRGDIHGRERVVLGATAKVEGNVFYGVIEMTLGAQIIGKLVRLEPNGQAAAPEPVPA